MKLHGVPPSWGTAHQFPLETDGPLRPSVLKKGAVVWTVEAGPYLAEMLELHHEGFSIYLSVLCIRRDTVTFGGSPSPTPTAAEADAKAGFNG